MVLILCLGDSNIPHRSSDLPQKFKELLKPGKIHQILCPGNLCSREFYDYLRTVCSSIDWARGDFDEDTQLPETVVRKIEGFTVGICHGHQVIPWGDSEALGILIRQLGVDILVTGHTHQHAIYNYENTLVVNPGSATGAYSLVNPNPIPSFVLMDLRKGFITLYLYQLVDDNLKVEKIEYSKPEEGNLSLVPENPTDSQTKAEKEQVEMVVQKPAESQPEAEKKKVEEAVQKPADSQPEAEKEKVEQVTQSADQSSGTDVMVEFAAEDGEQGQ
eukprot:TRINITY_DN2718_c0_g1_i1.p1 TRINITY_DN2718_c0_g1~~TRINITY_DN2718_c0_g1_i1.p1  ORF type:complete len:274 (-),score=43.91 TRINITY_DN2718_c0_g1_i1:202-1023(-)